MMKTIMLAISLMMASITGMNGVAMASEATKTIQDTNTIEVWYLYSNEDGTFWLEYGEEMDTIIHVGYNDLAKWKVDEDKLEYGFKMIGTFDKVEEKILSVNDVKQVKHEMVPVDIKESIVDNIVWEIERLIDAAGELRINMDRLETILK